MNAYEQIREALGLCSRIINDDTTVCACDIVDEAKEKVRAALALPLRQCDVGTAEEQSKRMDAAYCSKYRIRFDVVQPYMRVDGVNFPMMEMPIMKEEGGAK